MDVECLLARIYSNDDEPKITNFTIEEIQTATLAV